MYYMIAHSFDIVERGLDREIVMQGTIRDTPNHKTNACNST